MRYFLLFLFFLILPTVAKAQNAGNIVIDLADDRIDITSSFSGEKVTVFGTADQDGDIAIVLRGPQTRIVMRKKEPSLGMWLNRDSVDFKNVPLFYSYAVTRSEGGIADAQTLKNYGIGLNALEFDAAKYDDKAGIAEFQEALVRTQQAKGLFPLTPTPIRFIGQRLFKATFYLPSDVPVGQFSVVGYLFKDGAFVDSRTINLEVAQTGLSGEVLNFAADHSFAYALLGLFLAMMAGFTAFWMSRSQRA